MKIWLPYVVCGSGTDVFTRILGSALQRAGHQVVVTAFAHRWQYFPYPLARIQAPAGVDVILANSWNAFAFSRRNVPLVVVEHHCILDPEYAPYRNRRQALFHNTLVRRYLEKSLRQATAVVAVSRYTAQSMQRTLRVDPPHVIYNAVDTEFFSPCKPIPRTGPFRLLFVGNPSRRKGADLLPLIMSRLGADYQLEYTGGLRGERMQGTANMTALGRLTIDELKAAYNRADALLFPTRFEGFGYCVAEALATGTPVVATRSSSIPEIVSHGSTGMLCETDNVDQFVQAIKDISERPRFLEQLGLNARETALKRFSLEAHAGEYVKLFSLLRS